MVSDDGPRPTRLAYRKTLTSNVAKKEARKIKARRDRRRSVWFGLGMMGLVGWSVALPTILGVAMGAWIDDHWGWPFSATLTCLFLGLVAGCGIAWFWIKREITLTSDAGDGARASDDDEQGES